MNKAIFFGDSLTSGENNNDISYVNYVKYDGTTINCGVSGTTIGNYSIYPVGSNSLIDRLTDNRNCLSECTDVFLEYGINDAAAIACGYTSEMHVIVDFIKCIDLIKQINPSVKIHFIALSSGAVVEMSKLQATYLATDYLASIYNKQCDAITALMDKIASGYLTMLKSISCRSDIIMHYAICPSCFIEYLDSDRIHPNDEGYRLIASNIYS